MAKLILRNAWNHSRNTNLPYALFTRSYADAADPQSNTIGFIGLGNMGSHMARNLIKKKFNVIVNDINPSAVAALKEAGASSAESPMELATQTKTIISMLPSVPNVYSVYMGRNGVFKTVQAGSLLLDCSTIDPNVSRDMEKDAEMKGSTFMDCPVSGGVVAARDCLLTFMVGGKKFEDAQKILKNMGKSVINCGPVGTGEAAKICNNMLLAISMIGTAEAMNLGLRLGLEPKLLAKIINTSSGRCWSSEVYNPCPGVVMGIPSSNNYQGGFGCELMAKDLTFAETAAAGSSSPIPLGSVAHQMYRIMCNIGYARKDFSSVFQFLQQEPKEDETQKKEK